MTNKNILNKFRITHNSKYTFESAVNIGKIETRLTPRTCDYQRLDFSQIIITPLTSQYLESTDQFGNIVFQYKLNNCFQTLSVSANHTVSIFERKTINFSNTPSYAHAVTYTKNTLELQIYIEDSFFISRNEIFSNYAKKVFSPEASLLTNTESLCKQIYADFTYDPQATNVTTQPIYAFNLRRGVCQDFAHITICCLRSIGIASRYVSGYIDTKIGVNKNHPVAADASHAWISVYDPTFGWVDFDPTNNRIVDKSYIEIGYGRDYADLSPLTGHTDSKGKHKVMVAVDVKRIT